MRSSRLLLFVMVVSTCCSPSRQQTVANTARPVARPPAPRPSSLSGIVLDFYTRKPFASARLELKTYSGCGLALNTTTDAEGRFRFDGVSKCAPDDRLYLTGKDCADCMSQDPLTTDLKKLVARADSGDVGRILLAHDAWATTTFAKVCNGAAPGNGAAAEGAQLVAIGWHDGHRKWEGDFFVYGKFMTEPLVPWPALLCSRSTYTVVGTYGEDGYGAKGHAVDTRATLVRLQDGRRFSTSLHGDSPQRAEAHSGDHYGDTDEKLREWLKSLASKHPA